MRPSATGSLLAFVLCAACAHGGRTERSLPLANERAESGARLSHQQGQTEVRHSPPPSAEAYRAALEAELAVERGDLNGAVALFRAASLHDGGSPWLRVRLATLHLQLGDLRQARKQAEMALRVDEDELEARRLLALTHLLSGERRAAERVIRHTLLKSPGHLPSSRMLAELYLQEERIEEAEAVVEEWMRSDPAAIDGWLALAQLLAERGDVEAALNLVNRVLERDASALEALELRLNLLYALGRFPEAPEVARRIASERGDSLEMRQLYLTARLLGGERAEAEELTRLWLADDQSDTMRLMVVSAYEAAGLPEAALRLLSVAKEGSPSARVALAAGRLAFGLRDYDAAHKALCGVVPTDGSDMYLFAQTLCAKAWLAIGHTENALRVVDAGLEHSPVASSLLEVLVDLAAKRTTNVDREGVRQRLKSLLVDHPKDAGLLEVAVHAEERLSGPSDAQDLLTTALHAAADHPELQWVRARHLERQGDALGAVRIAEELLARTEHPSVDGLNFLAYTLADHELRRDEAERFAWRAVVHGPLNGYVLDTLGWAQFRNDKAELAAETLQRALRLAPDEAEIELHLGEVLAALGRAEEARPHLERLLTRAIDDERLLRRVQALKTRLQVAGT
ncbi:MAG: tetratricopeptide repeat protein [Myxococcota bacterium]